MKGPRGASRKSTEVVAKLYTQDYASGDPYGVGFGMSASGGRVDWVVILIPSEHVPGMQEAIRVAGSHETLPMGRVSASQILIRIPSARDLAQVADQAGFWWEPAEHTRKKENT